MHAPEACESHRAAHCVGCAEADVFGGGRGGVVPSGTEVPGYKPHTESAECVDGSRAWVDGIPQHPQRYAMDEAQGDSTINVITRPRYILYPLAIHYA